MKKVAEKGKKAVFYVLPPKFLLLLVLGILWWGTGAALAGYVVYKIVHSVTGILA